MKSDAPLIFIVILNWNGKKDTLACLASLEKVSYSHFQTVVVDNGSSDDSVEAISSAFPNLSLLTNKENLGFAQGNNVGIDFALKEGAEWIFLLNNDTVVDHNILAAFVSHFDKYPDSGVVGGTPYLFEQRDQLDHLGGRWNKKTARFDLVGLRSFKTQELFKEPPLLDYACGCALMIKRKVIKTIGMLEPKFFLIWEEADFCMRAKRAGFGVSVCQEAILFHKVSASFVGGKTHTNYFWWRNRLLWIERNCTLREKRLLYRRVLIPELIHLYKLKLLKSLQVVLTRLALPHKDQSQRREKLRNYRASLTGAKDYFFRRFGNGPPWIFKKEQ